MLTCSLTLLHLFVDSKRSPKAQCTSTSAGSVRLLLIGIPLFFFPYPVSQPRLFLPTPFSCSIQLAIMWKGPGNSDVAGIPVDHSVLPWSPLPIVSLLAEAQAIAIAALSWPSKAGLFLQLAARWAVSRLVFLVLLSLLTPPVYWPVQVLFAELLFDCSQRLWLLWVQSIPGDGHAVRLQNAVLTVGTTVLTGWAMQRLDAGLMAQGWPRVLVLASVQLLAMLSLIVESIPPWMAGNEASLRDLDHIGCIVLSVGLYQVSVWAPLLFFIPRTLAGILLQVRDDVSGGVVEVDREALVRSDKLVKANQLCLKAAIDGHKAVGELQFWLQMAARRLSAGEPFATSGLYPTKTLENLCTIMRGCGRMDKEMELSCVVLWLAAMDEDVAGLIVHEGAVSYVLRLMKMAPLNGRIQWAGAGLVSTLALTDAHRSILLKEGAGPLLCAAFVPFQYSPAVLLNVCSALLNFGQEKAIVALFPPHSRNHLALDQLLVNFPSSSDLGLVVTALQLRVHLNRSPTAQQQQQQHPQQWQVAPYHEKDAVARLGI